MLGAALTAWERIDAAAPMLSLTAGPFARRPAHMIHSVTYNCITSMLIAAPPHRHVPLKGADDGTCVDRHDKAARHQCSKATLGLPLSRPPPQHDP